MSQLSIKSLTKSYGAFKVFENLNLEANTGEIVVVFGGSGTGKTILLRLIAGVEDPTSGTIELAGRDMTDVPPEARDVGMAFQNFALFPHMSARDNIAAPLRARSASDSVIGSGVDRVANLLKISHVLGHAPRELSNGQKQRTSLARALAAEPRILLLDDPLRNVDAKLRFEMRLELPRLLRQSGSTVLYVTQDYKEAMALADRIAVLSEGRFVQIASPEEIYRKPASLQVARLFGDPSINIVDVTPRMNDQDLVIDIAGETVKLDRGYASIKDRAVTLGVRPEAISLGPVRGANLAADVQAITPLNERTVLLLRSKGGWEFLVSLPSSSADIPQPNTATGVTFDPAGTHLFDRASGTRIEPGH